MSQTFHHDFVPLEALVASGTPKYWQSLAEREGTFASEPNEEFGEEGIETSGASRRRFLSLMAGSMALAGLTGCTRQPTETIMPYVDPPGTSFPAARNTMRRPRR